MRDRDPRYEPMLPWLRTTSHSHCRTPTLRSDVFGLRGGDGIRSGRKWELDVIYPWWPRATVISPAAPQPLVCTGRSRFDRATAIKLTLRCGLGMVCRSGFASLSAIIT